MSSAPNKLIAIGFAAIGAGYVWELLKDGSRPVTPFGVGPDGLRPNLPYASLEGQQVAPTHRQLAGAPEYKDGRVLAGKDGVKTIKFHPAGSIENRLKFIIDQMKKDAKDPKTITEATTILSGKCPTAKGGLKWCLPVGTLILRKPYDLVPIEEIRPGDVIMGDGGWTEVLSTFDMGVQPLLAFTLNNGSVLRCTAEHKLFVVPRVARNGKPIPRGKKVRESFPGKRSDVIEVLAKDIREGDELLQPESLPFGHEEIDPGRALIMGAYISEGWLEPSRASIAGIPEGKGVREKVIAAAERLGIPYAEDKFKVRLKSRAVADWLAVCGKLARNKQLPTLNIGEETVRALLTGINADAGMCPMRKESVPKFCTTSPALAQQYRLLYRMLGHSSAVAVSAPRQAGYNPIYSVHVRTKLRSSGVKQWAKVTKVEKQASEQTYDLETASRRIYLPECDVVVHNCVPVKGWKSEIAMLFYALTNPNSPYSLRYTRDPKYYDAFRSADLMRRIPATDCDDMAIRLGAWLLAVGYSVKCRIVAPAGQPGAWSHIYLMVGTPPGEDKKWLALDPTEADRGPFWEVPNYMISSKRDFNV